MAGRALDRLTTGLAERFASTWLLLSDTTNFLSRTSIFGQYELQLMDFRRRLASAGRTSDVEKTVRKELTELRAALRVQGYDLSLGKLDLAFQGFRNDASLVEGFRRLVLFIGPREVWFLDGEENHLSLHRHLEAALSEVGAEILQKHYLWYRWNHEQLIISGSDTEAKDDFEELKAWCGNPERRLYLLGRMKRLK
jgi:hypothetical protein